MDNDNANNADGTVDGGAGSLTDEFDDLDFDFEDEDNDLVPILSLSALFAAVVGAILVLIGRRRTREPSPKERLEDVLAETRKLGKRGAKAASKAASSVPVGNLTSLLGDAIDMATHAARNVDLGDVAKGARRATRNVKLGDMLSDALDQVREAADNIDVADAAKTGRKEAGRLFSRARDAAENVDVGDIARDVRKQAEGVLSGVRDAGRNVDVAGAAASVGKRAGEMVSNVDIDRKGVESLLDTLKDRLGEAIDSVRNDIAPKAADRLKSDVLPAAQDAMETVAGRVRDDVLPAAQDAMERVRDTVGPVAENVSLGRAGKFAEDLEVGRRARTIASAAGRGTASFGEMVRDVALAVAAKVLDDVLPQARKAGGKAVTYTREEIIPTATQTAGDAAHRVRDDVLPRMADMASQTPDVLSDLLSMARERVEDALDKAQPVAADAMEYGRHRASDAAIFGRHRAAEAAIFGRHRAADVASGARKAGAAGGSAAAAAGRGVSGAVGTAVGASVSFTKETTGLFFWLSTLGGLVLLVFVPDKERQAEIWHNTRQVLNEVREMWHDLQGSEAGSEA
jgi:hypothetical protein